MSLDISERPLTQNQRDALDYLNKGGFIKVSGKRIQFIGKECGYIIQHNTFTSLHRRGLLKLDHCDGEADYYTVKKDEK